MFIIKIVKPSGSSDPTFFGAAGIDILDRDLLPSSPGDPRALPEIFDFFDGEEVEQPTAPELAPSPELEPRISDEDRKTKIVEESKESSWYYNKRG